MLKDSYPTQLIGNPWPLRQNSGMSFMGSVVLGKGFLLSRQEAENLITKDARNKDVLFPYLIGDDLNNNPQQKASRWIINFFDWSEDRARTYPDCFEIVERLVKPERQRPNNNMGRNKWWQYYRRGVELYETISQLDQVMALNRHAKYLLISIGKKDIVYSDATIVFALASYSDFAILSSSIHEVWAWKNSSTMGASTLRYSAVNAFETFPFPEKSNMDLKEMGAELNRLRKNWMTNNKKGLTDLQNLYHTRTNQSNLQIEQIRNSFIKIDQAVLNTYGWTDIDLRHDFYEMDYLPENDRIRYSIHPNARKEILKRLMALNHKIYNEEKVTQEINTISKKSTSKKVAKKVDLFSGE